MRRFMAGCTSLAVALMPAGQAFAYTSKQKAAAIPVVSSGVTPTQSLSSSIVLQGSNNDTGTASTLTFGAGGNTYRDSGRAIKVDVNTNLAGNRILIYTENLLGTAIPQCSLNTELGNDCGGLIGVTDKSQVVPMLWGVEEVNVDYSFGSIVGDNEVFITDRAHVTTYVDAVIPLATAAEKQKLDTLALKRCDTGASVSNADNVGAIIDPNDPERYPQFFGSPGVANSDLCSAAVSQVTIDPDDTGTAPNIVINPNAKVLLAEELSKNIAVVAFSCLGLVCTAPELTTAIVTDSKTVNSPFFMPLAADFRTAPGQDYATSTLTLELVTQ